MNTSSVYLLRDPRDRQVRYVGVTVKTLERRLREHVLSANYARNVAPRYVWLRELMSLQLRPVIELIETVDADSRDERERFWISVWRAQGADLVNVKSGGGGTAPGSTRSKPWSSAARAAQAQRLKHLYDSDPERSALVSDATKKAMAAWSTTEAGQQTIQQRANSLRAKHASSEGSALRKQMSCAQQQRWSQPGAREEHAARQREATAREKLHPCAHCGRQMRRANLGRHELACAKKTKET